MTEKSTLEKLQEELKDARAPWYERIAIHNNAIGTITGFSIAVLGAFVAFANDHLTLIEAVLLTAAAGVLFELGHYWMRQVERDREIEWNIYMSLYEKKFGDPEESTTYIKNGQRLRQENTDEGKGLNNLVRWSLGLTLLLLILHGWLSVPGFKDFIMNLIR